MPPDDQLDPGASADPIDDAIDAPPAANPALSLTPEAIRNSPEFRALASENRKLARQKGDAEKAAAAARTAAEEARQAAEAQQQAALETDIMAALGEDGVAVWGELADLSVSDPRAAARRFAEVMANARVQSPAPADPAAGGDDAAAGGEGVPAQTPPPPSRGVDGGQPIGQAASGQDPQAIIAELEKGFVDVVDRVQDPITRNRVTMRDRAGAMMNFLAASYLKGGAEPREPR